MIEYTRAVRWVVAGCVVGALGCDALAAPVVDGPVRVVPTDNRPAQHALTTLPPISGGTLALNSGGTLAVVADPDRGVISVVDLVSGSVVGRVALEAGDEPGRVAIGPDGLAYVALRRSGDLLTLDTATASVVRRSAVCGAPRGVAYDATTDRVHVACAGGDLVAIGARTGVEAWRTQIDVDLRDIIVQGDHLVVSRFKSADQLRVDKQGRVMTHSKTATLEHSDSDGTARKFEPTTAWRTVAAPDGGVVTLHQRAQTSEVVINRKPDPAVGGSSYGGGGGSFNFGQTCNGIVHSAVTVVDAFGGVQTSPPIPDVVLAVDAAVSSDWIALAVAGPADHAAPRPFTVFSGDDSAEAAATFGGFSQTGSVALVSRSSLSVAPRDGTDASTFGCAQTVRVAAPITNDGTVAPQEQVTSVAFTSSGALVYVTRDPSTVNIVQSWDLQNGGTSRTRIELGGDSIADTGHDLFHSDSGGGIACASCHAEGGDDGHVWEFNTIGQRRTQAINVGLEGTAPFHWDGDMVGLHEIMDDVFVGRMGGVRQSDERLGALSDWVFEQAPPAPIRQASDPAAIRGHELFSAPDVGCASCHSGTKLTNNLTVAVGTGELGQRFQVPSLVGIGYRAPFLHTGCAPTLRARFTDTSCAGGDEHGVTSQLNEGQIDDLVAYLETL